MKEFCNSSVSGSVPVYAETLANTVEEQWYPFVQSSLEVESTKTQKRAIKKLLADYYSKGSTSTLDIPSVLLGPQNLPPGPLNPPNKPPKTPLRSPLTPKKLRHRRIVETKRWGFCYTETSINALPAYVINENVALKYLLKLFENDLIPGAIIPSICASSRNQNYKDINPTYAAKNYAKHNPPPPAGPGPNNSPQPTPTIGPNNNGPQNNNGPIHP